MTSFASRAARETLIKLRGVIIGALFYARERHGNTATHEERALQKLSLRIVIRRSTRRMNSRGFNFVLRLLFGFSGNCDRLAALFRAINLHLRVLCRKHARDLRFVSIVVCNGDFEFVRMRAREF